MKKYKMNRFKSILQSFGIVLLISAVSIIIYDIYINIEVESYQEDSKQEVTTQKMVQADSSIENNQDITNVIEEVSQAVVGISKLQDKGLSIFGINSIEQLGLGTGLVISEDGYILTNQHVSGGKYNTCYVTTSDGEDLTGTVIWADESLDLSIIKVNKTGLKVAKLGDSNNIRVGNQVYAIGNPIGFEFQRTVTSRNYKCS